MDSEMKTKIQSIIDESIKLSEPVKIGIIKKKDIEDFFHSSLAKIYNILQKDSTEYKLFDKWKIEKHGKTLRRCPRDEENYTNNDDKIRDLRDFLSKLIGYKTIDNEKHFKAGDEYEARRYFNKLFSSAKSDILIVDEYIDSNVFDFIEEIDENISIKILTGNNYKKGFKGLYLSYNKGNLETKKHTTNNHDRYIVLDKKELYLSGCSLNGIGKSDFSIKKLDNITKITDLFGLRDSGINI